jgi:hypothetical protein
VNVYGQVAVLWVAVRGSDFEMAKLQCIGLFAFGVVRFTSETDVVLGLGHNGMIRGPSATGDGFVLQYDLDGMPVVVGNRWMRNTARLVVWNCHGDQ